MLLSTTSRHAGTVPHLTDHWLLAPRPLHLIRLAAWTFYYFSLVTFGQELDHPLKPPDRSSPRAAIKTFIEAGHTLRSYMVRDYIPSPSRAKYEQLTSLADVAVRSLDLSAVPPAARSKTGRSAALALYETLCRIPLPPLEEVPGGDPAAPSPGTNVLHWVIPNTEIDLVRVPSGPRAGEYVFSPETVTRAADFYRRVRELPYLRPVPLKDLAEIVANGGGWMVPYEWIEALPAWLREPLGGQPGWKWLSLAAVFGFFLLLLRMIYRLSRRGNSRRPFLRALALAALPGYLLLAVPGMAYLALVQINLTGAAGSTIGLLESAVRHLAGAWIAWRLGPVIAEGIIASPRIAPQSVDAHLIRICTSLLGFAGAATLLALGADKLGLPVYGIVAGLGVGGLAIALAAQSTIENLIGGLNLFADKPIRVGDFCKYGDDIGTVEAIGIRSTRIRGIDRTLTTIPNAVLAKVPIVNFAVRDRMLLKAVIGLRYETRPEQLRHVLAKLRELLLAHPKVTPEPARVRLIGFGASSLNLEVFAYIDTQDWNEFLEIQEDIHLRMMDVVAASGTGFAFPSQTLYFARDAGLDPDKSAAAMEQVQRWRAEHKLPFPNFDLEFRRTHRDTLEYPPAGSATAGHKPQE